MDSEVKITLPQADHLLGYAEKKQPPWLKIGLIAISALVLAGAVLGIGFLTVGKIPQPKNQIVSLVVRGGTKLPDFAPRLWREAAESNHFPVMLGLSDESGKIVATAVTPRWSNVKAKNRQDIGMFSLASDEQLEPAVHADGIKTSFALLELLANPAYLNLDPSRFGGTDKTMIAGPINEKGWHTDFRLAHADGPNGSDEDALVDLEAFPEAWPMINRTIKQATGIEINEVPSTIGFNLTKNGLDGLKLTFAKTPADATLLNLAGSIGITDLAPYTLPDGTIVIELKLPTQKLGQTANLTKADAWKEISVENGNLMDRGPAASTDRTGCAPGRLVFKLSRNALSNIFDAFKISDANHDLELHEDAGKLSACYQ